MICVDSSAIVAIVKGEPERDGFIEAFRRAEVAFLSDANFLESAMICEGLASIPGAALFDTELAVLRELGLVTVAFDNIQAELVREGFRRFGKGHHPAGLNFGDCFAYALAKALDAPLLFKGEDFAKTDVKRA